MAQTVVIDITARFTDETSKGLNKASKSADKLGDSLKKTQKQIDKIGNSKSDIKLEVKDKAFQSLNKISKGVKDITSKKWNLTVKAIDKATAPIRGIFNLLKNPIVQAGAILGVSIGVKDTIDTYANFEATMSKVQAISSASTEEMTAINAKAKEIGATTKFTSTQAGEAFTYMAMAGWRAEQMLGGIDGVMNLAASSGEDVALVSDIVTDSMTAFGIAADGFTNGINNVTHFSDVLAAAASNSNTNVAMLGESFKYAGALAGQFKFSVEDTALALGLMANAGIKSSSSGTALRKIFTQFSSDFEVNQADGKSIKVETTNADGSMRSLKDIIDDTRAAFNGMSIAEKEAIQNDLANTASNLGIALSKENGELKTQGELYDEVMQSAKGMTDAGRVAEAEALAGKTAMAGLLSILGASEEEYNKLATAVYNADGTAAEMAAIMMNNLQGDMILFQSAADGVKIAFMEKLSPYLRSFVQWITNKMPDVSKTMERVADKIGNGIDDLRDKIQDFTSTNEWKDADFFGKVSIAWNEIVAEPFGEWWDSTGKEWFADKANGIGEGIGKGISNGLLVLLGFDIQGVAEDGISIGTSFAEGFSKGFDGKKIGEAFLNAVKGVFKDAGTLFPGGEKASGTSGLSAALLAFLGFKAGKAGYGVFKGVSSIFGGSNKSGLGSLMGQSVTTNTMNVAAAVVNISGGFGRQGIPTIGSAGGTTPLLTGGGSAIAGKYIVTSSGGVVAGSTNSAIIAGLANTGYGLGSGASTVGGAAAVGGASIAGALFGTLGIGAGLFDFLKASELKGKDKRDKNWQGGTKIGMVGAGAAAGAGIGAMFGGVGAIPGALIGAGIGGAGALFKGDKIGKFISDFADGTREIERTKVALEKVGQEVDYFSEKKNVTDNLIEEYNKLNAKISDGNIGVKERNDLEKQQKETVEKLRELYPEIISQYDAGQGKLSEQLDTIKKISDMNSSMALKELEIEVSRGKLTTPDLKKQFEESKQEEKDFQSKVGLYDKYTNKVQSFYSTIQEYTNERNVAQKNKDFEGVNYFNDKLNEALKEVNDWISETNYSNNNNLFSLGLSSNYGSVDEFNMGYGGFIEQYKEMLDNYSVHNQKITELQNSYGQLYESEKKLYEIKLGMSLEDAAKKFNTLDDASKGIFEEALASLEHYKNELDMLPQEKTTEINTIYRTQTIVGPEQTTDIKDWNFNFNKLDKHATGGLITKPHVGLIGEAGPEVIIPLSGANKKHGINLWEKTGELLGLIPKHAQGGIFGNTVNLKNTSSGRNSIYDMLNGLNDSTDSKSNESKNTINNSNPISVNLGGINFNFNGSGTMDKESIMQIIREQMPEIADEVAETIATALKKLFPNMKAGII